LLIVDQVLPPFVENSHRITFPVWPDKVSVPLLLPEQTVALPLTAPPTEATFTVMVAALELTVEHPPITARYCLVWVRLLYVCEVVVFAISVQVLPPFVENCHLVIVPD
jgi:hypothetical protein